MVTEDAVDSTDEIEAQYDSYCTKLLSRVSLVCPLSLSRWPAEAVLWRDDEFGYPPSPRDGPRDLADLDPDSGLSATVHLRAADLRL